MSSSGFQPSAWRVVTLHCGVDLSAEAGGGSYSFEVTYAVPDDGRDIAEMTLAELQAYPIASATALLGRVVSDHRQRRRP